MNCGIYRITIGDKYYYGQSSRLKKRTNEHRSYLNRGCHPNKFMQAAYDKYQDYKYEIILYCDEDNLDMYEQKFLDEHYGLEDCMNLSKCAEATRRGHAMSEETKQKLRNRVITDEWRANIGRASKGRVHSPESRKRISEAITGVPRPNAVGGKNHRARKVMATLPDGTIKVWDTVKEAAEEVGYDRSFLSKVCRGLKPQPGTSHKYKKTEHIWGWVFTYI